MRTHPFTESTLHVASRKLDNALAKLEEFIDGPAGDTRDPRMLFSEAYRELLQMRGIFHAAMQLEHMTAEVERADTELPPQLRIVK